MKYVVLFCALLAVGFGTDAQGGRPRPECAPPARPHCHITWVGYSYIQRGHDQFGNRYVRTCHVPAHSRRWCGPWRVAP